MSGAVATPSRQELRQLARAHPVAWAMYASEGKWQRSRHLMWLADLTLKMWRGQVRRVCVSMPPRHGKSQFLSMHLPTWWLGTRPESKVILCSYGEKLTVEWSRAARDLFSEHAPVVFGVDTWARASVTAWNVYTRAGKLTGGGMRAVGKGGSLTGRGADLLILDDLIKDDEEANNDALREAAWDWFQSVAMTRLEPGGVAIIVQTRWHHDDIVGRLEQKQKAGEVGEPWTFINLPAIAEPDDPLGRTVGEALWPERYDIKALENIRVDRGPYVWQALFQGAPTPKGGAIFKRDWCRYYTRGEMGGNIEGEGPVDFNRMIRFATVDLAASTKNSADFTVASAWALDVEKHRLFLMDRVRIRAEGPEIIPMLQELVGRWNLGTVWIERVAWQLFFIQQARRDLPVRELVPDRDKLSRALPATAMMASGQVYWPSNAPWLTEWEAELLAFPAGGKDDQVDTFSYAVIIAQGLRVVRPNRGGGRPGGQGPSGGSSPRGWRLGR